MEHQFLIGFLMGSAVVAGAAWIAEYFDPKLGGIIADIPSATILALLIISSVLSEKGAILYAKGLVIGNIPWYGYILAVLLFAQRKALLKVLPLD